MPLGRRTKVTTLRKYAHSTMDYQLTPSRYRGSV
jgi:hypothetical protein